MTVRYVLIGLALASSACASASPIEPIATSEDRIVGGAPSDHAGVVAIRRRSNDALCTGALVAPDRVLTAAHCIFGVAATDLQVTFGPDMSAPEEQIDVRAVSTYPTFTGTQEDRLGGVDLGIVTLARSTAVRPIPIRDPNTSIDFLSVKLTIVGYGVTNGPDDTGRGTRRAIVTTVKSACTRMIRLGDGAMNSCNGDSGGPLLIDGALVGVVSSGVPGCAGPSHHTRLDAHAAWLGRIASGTVASCPECFAASGSCEAPIEPRSATPDPTTSGGGCNLAGSTSSGAGLWLLLGIVAALGTACRSRSEARPTSEEAGAPLENPDAVKQVTKADCAKWSTRALDVVVEDIKIALGDCPQSFREQTLAQLTSDRASMLEHLVGICEKQIGSDYRIGAAQCVLAAKSAMGISECKLAQLTAPGEADPGQAVADIKRMCAKGGAGVPSAKASSSP